MGEEEKSSLQNNSNNMCIYFPIQKVELNSSPLGCRLDLLTFFTKKRVRKGKIITLLSLADPPLNNWWWLTSMLLCYADATSPWSDAMRTLHLLWYSSPKSIILIESRKNIRQMQLEYVLQNIWPILFKIVSHDT